VDKHIQNRFDLIEELEAIILLPALPDTVRARLLAVLAAGRDTQREMEYRPDHERRRMGARQAIGKRRPTAPGRS
jgi:hypothetical protein